MLHPPPPPIGVVGSYNHHDIGEEVEWRLLLMYAHPLGHRVPANLKNQMIHLVRSVYTTPI